MIFELDCVWVALPVPEVGANTGSKVLKFPVYAFVSGEIPRLAEILGIPETMWNPLLFEYQDQRDNDDRYNQNAHHPRKLAWWNI
jgi:hypothetical protein